MLCIHYRVGVIVIGNCNWSQSITSSQVIVITISRCSEIVIDYLVNIIVISDYFHNYTRCNIYHVISCQKYGLVCKAKVNNRTDLLIDRLLSCLYKWRFVSSLVLWAWKGNVLKHYFRCCLYYNSYKQAFQINLCCFQMVKPKIVTHAASMTSFWHHRLNYSCKWSRLASSQMTSSQLN